MKKQKKDSKSLQIAKIEKMKMSYLILIQTVEQTNGLQLQLQIKIVCSMHSSRSTT